MVEGRILFKKVVRNWISLLKIMVYTCIRLTIRLKKMTITVWQIFPFLQKCIKWVNEITLLNTKLRNKWKSIFLITVVGKWILFGSKSLSLRLKSRRERIIHKHSRNIIWILLPTMIVFKKKFFFLIFFNFLC